MLQRAATAQLLIMRGNFRRVRARPALIAHDGTCRLGTRAQLPSVSMYLRVTQYVNIHRSEVARYQNDFYLRSCTVIGNVEFKEYTHNTSQSRYHRFTSCSRNDSSLQNEWSSKKPLHGACVLIMTKIQIDLFSNCDIHLYYIGPNKLEINVVQCSSVISSLYLDLNMIYECNVAICIF